MDHRRGYGRNTKYAGVKMSVKGFVIDGDDIGSSALFATSKCISYTLQSCFYIDN